jgi:hypothetical protein
MRCSGVRLALACMLLGLLHGQTAGWIAGRVLDESQSVVQGAIVTLRNSSTGAVRTTLSGADGWFAFPGSERGVYEVQAEKPGLAKRRVELSVGEGRQVDLLLSVATTRSSLQVVGFADSVNETAKGETIRGRSLESLPINGRDYARFSTLTPGALVRTNQIADLSFQGLHSNHNYFAIDGVDATRVDQPFMANGAERGARLLTGGMDAIAEFRIVTSSYQAEFGRAASAYVTIATKSGDNSWHGGAAHRARHDRLDARNYFSQRPSPKPTLRYHNTSANLSGPLVRNRSFFLASYEGSRQQVGVVGSGTVPSQRFRDDVAMQSPVLRPILEEMPLGMPTNALADPLVYSVTRTERLGVREDTSSLRLDLHGTGRHAGFARLNVNDTSVSGPLFSVQPAALGIHDRQRVPVRTLNSAVSHQYSSGRVLNHILFGVQRNATRLETDESGVPLISVTGLTAQVGSRGRSGGWNTRYQLGNTLTTHRGRHIFKTGLHYWHTRLTQMSSPLVLLVYASLPSFAANRAASATVVPGNPGSALVSGDIGGFAQDTWKPRERLTLDFGLRYDYFSPPRDPQNLARPFSVSANRLAAPGSPPFLGNRTNFGPRLGAAWAALPRLAVRVGYGIFFSAYPPGTAALPANTLPGNTTILAQQNPSLGFPFRPDVAPGTTARPNVMGFEPNKPDLRAHHWNAALETPWRRADILHLAYTGNAGRHLQRARNRNLLNPLTGRRPLVDFANVTVIEATGASSYHALEVGWRRTAGPLNGAVHYTWGHAIDDVQDPAVSPSALPQNQANSQAEKGHSSSDTRHRAVAQGNFDLPGRSGHRWWGGWTLSGIATVRSGVAQTVFIGLNTFGDGNLVNQRPDAVARAQRYPQQKTVQRWYDPAAYRLPAPGTFGNLGRNTVFGPGMVQLDLALRKGTSHGRFSMSWSVEAFNVSNHPNFAQPNSIFGTAAFGRILNTLGNTIGAGTARQIQAGVKVGF